MAVTVRQHEATWYYEEHGARKGPVTQSEMEDLVWREEIQADTLVWSGSGQWLPAAQSELSPFFADTPPPLPTISNTYIWLVVAVPIVAAAIEQEAQQHLTSLYIAANIGCVLDARTLRKAGYRTPHLGWVFLVPVYLWKRARLLNRSTVHFWSWFAAFVVAALFSPYSNPFAQARIEWTCNATGGDSYQCAFSNVGSAPGSLCTEVVIICEDGKHRARVCSDRIPPGGKTPKVVRGFAPPF